MCPAAGRQRIFQRWIIHCNSLALRYTKGGARNALPARAAKNATITSNTNSRPAVELPGICCRNHSAPAADKTMHSLLACNCSKLQHRCISQAASDEWQHSSAHCLFIPHAGQASCYCVAPAVQSSLSQAMTPAPRRALSNSCTSWPGKLPVRGSCCLALTQPGHN